MRTTTQKQKTPSAKQLAARRKFALAAKARAKAAKAKHHNAEHQHGDWAAYVGKMFVASGATKADAVKRAKKAVKPIYWKEITARKSRVANKTIIVKPKRVLVMNGKKTRRKYRNGYLDLVIRGTAEKTAQGWKVGKKLIPQGKGIAPLSSGYYLDKATGTVFAKRERNVAQGFFDGNGVFHPIRSSADYDGGTAGETGGKPRHTRSKKKLAATKKASATARHLAATKARKATTSRLASRSLFRSVPLKRARRNPSVTEIRERFSGQPVRQFSKMVAADGTPKKLAKLGKLVLIKAPGGKYIPLPSRTVWLCCDTKGKLHLTADKGVLYEGTRVSLPEVSQIEYEEQKPHLGYPKKTIFFHKMGEEGGKKPVLIGDGKGGLKLRGGSYRIEREGIVD
jgi:hypothetical protein